MPVNAQFIGDDIINVAQDMDAFKKVRLGFIIDNVRYHICEYDIIRLGYWVVKV
jgi:hypothetical protein